MSGTPFRLTQFVDLDKQVSRALAKMLEDEKRGLLPARLMRGIGQDSAGFQSAIQRAVQEFYDDWNRRDPQVLADGRAYKERLDDLLRWVCRTDTTGWEVVYQDEDAAKLRAIELPHVEIFGLEYVNSDGTYPSVREWVGSLMSHTSAIPLDVYVWAELYASIERGGIERFPKHWNRPQRQILFPGTLVALGQARYYPMISCSGTIAWWKLQETSAILNPNTTCVAILPR